MKNKFLKALFTGFALFSMFFGSGNLVFPILVGQQSAGALFTSSLGILLTGVIVPFLGVFAMVLYKGDLVQFFNCMGKRAVFWFSLFALAIMGPFGVLARCITVAYGSIHLLVPSLSLPVVSWILCGILFAVTVNKNKIVTLLGTYLTPILLGALALIAVFGIFQGTWPEASLQISHWQGFKIGFFQGYQTMDLLAAFFFSTFILVHLAKAEGNSDCETRKNFSYAALIGASLLALVYISLVVIGAKHAELLIGVPPHEMLGTITMAVLGPIATPVISITIVLACMTTAIVLASLFADFIHKEISQEKIGFPVALIITLAISFFVSTLDFSGIAMILGPILETIYPALIVLTVVNIIHKLIGYDRSHWPVTLALAAKLCI
jgi:LIVCS family branched-chain amino acid:cation transporter